MNFGDILENWEKQKPKNRIYDKDADESKDLSDSKTLREINHKRRTRLLRQRPDAAIDLHGLSSNEAWNALNAFFSESRQKGCEKVLIIHGKGNHLASSLTNAGVLRDLSKRFIESCPIAGENGICSSREGGTGATWVILK